MPDEQKPQTQKVIPLEDFLQSSPLNTEVPVMGYWITTGAQGVWQKETPIAKFFCPTCEGERRFGGRWSQSKIYGENFEKKTLEFVTYTCRDCGEFHKVFCLQSEPSHANVATLVKIGEYPDASIGIPPELREIVGSDYKYIVSGLKCEIKGQGIGAFAYYRRVVENMKDRLIGQLIKVLKAENKTADIAILEKAKTQFQFKQAMEDIQDHIPASLFIAGKNPLKVLHDALSIGVHELEDESCLTKATAIRLVLFELSTRVRELTKEHNTLKKAIHELENTREDKA